MFLGSSSVSSRGGLALLTLTCAWVGVGCQVDERELSLATGGATSGGAGSESGSSSVAGSGSADQAGGANAGGGSLGGALGAAGADAGIGGEGGLSGPSAGATDAAGTPSGGAAASAGASGIGGQAASACGDIDQDMVDDCAETLVQNSRFDSNLDYWAAEPLETQTWDARNARSGTSSGSILISNVAPVDPAPGSFMVGGHQCVQVTAGASYEVAARVLIPSAQGAGEAGINLQIFGADDCAGSFLEAQTVASTSAVDSWLVVQGEMSMPATARSMWVRLVASKPFAQATLEALFDDVLVRQN